MSDSIDLILYGHPLVSEVRERAVWDLKRIGRTFTSDVDILVSRTVYSPQAMEPAMAYHRHVEQVLLACLQLGTIPNRRAIRQITYRRPVVTGLDSLYVQITKSDDRLVLV